MSISLTYSDIQDLERVNTTIKRIKGKIKEKPEDFIVEERIRGVQLDINKDYESENEDLMSTVVEQEEKEDEEEEKKWLVCVIKKRGIDTFRAIHIITSYLSMSPNRISIAGIKDKKAYTVQLISIYKVSESKVRRALSLIYNKYNSITLYPISYGKKVYLGELEGNRFILTIRDKEGNLEEVIKKHERKYELLFPNYFGEQRFGGKGMYSIEVAKYILRGEIKEGINAFVLKNKYKEMNLEEMDITQIRELKEKQVKGLYERRVLDYLMDHNLKDYAAAWDKVIPDSLKRLIINTYQSYVFNIVASQIIRESKERYGEDKGVKRCKDKSILLPFSDTIRKIEKEEYDEKIKEILERDGISYGSFSNPLLSKLGIKGVKRKIIEQATELEIIEEKEKEAKIRFFLKKGSYATEFLKEIIDFG